MDAGSGTLNTVRPFDFAGATALVVGGASGLGRAMAEALAQHGASVCIAARTEEKARALMDQWGVGRKGFDDGLVIFFDMQPNLEHGQVQLYAGPGFESTFLSNAERQAIYDNDMLPHLQAGDFDAALAAALAKVDAAATPDHAQQLERGRQINAVVGLVGAPVVLFGLIGWGLWSWRAARSTATRLTPSSRSTSRAPAPSWGRSDQTRPRRSRSGSCTSSSRSCVPGTTS